MEDLVLIIPFVMIIQVKFSHPDKGRNARRMTNRVFRRSSTFENGGIFSTPPDIL